jgi:hypothetical protein
MRIWQEYLFNYKPAQDDFITWVEEIKQGIIKQIVEESKSGNSAKIMPLAIELAVYETIASRFRAEFRERQALNERSNK